MIHVVLFAELVSRDEPTTSLVGGPLSDVNNNNGERCKSSETKIFDDSGRVVKRSCVDELIFEDDFKTLNESKWLVKEYFAGGPVSMSYFK